MEMEWQTRSRLAYSRSWLVPPQLSWFTPEALGINGGIALNGMICTR